MAKCDFKHQHAGRGENLAINTGNDVDADMAQAFSDWYNEINQYNYDLKKCGNSCHYTQVTICFI